MSDPSDSPAPPPPAPAVSATLAKTPSQPALPARLIATWFGAGRSPVAPGTMGTLGAVPFAYLLSLGPRWLFVLGLIAVTAIGTWAAEQFVRATGVDDDQRIVVDEVAGYMLTLIAVPKTPLHLAFAFVLFRIFDIWKPQPVRWVDDNLTGGIGVMADDLAAGVYAGLVLIALEWSGAIAHIAAWLK